MRIRGLFLFRRYTLQAFIVILLLSALILVSLRVKQRRGVDLFDAILLEVSSPFQKTFTFVIKSVQGVFQEYLFLVNVQTENKRLRQRMAELQRENQEMKEISLANERFKKLLQFQEKISLPVTAAQVVGQDPTSWFRSITINKGEKDGLQKGMAVISPEGVVGQILRVSPHYSVVLLLTDYNSAIDAVAQRTRAKAIVEGKGENRCQLKYLLRAEDVSIGDIAVTSGLGGNFPKGLVIGEIKQVDKKGHGIFQYAELVPSVDLTRLEEVLVITDALRPPVEEKTKKTRGPKEGTKVPLRKSGPPR